MHIQLVVKSLTVFFGASPYAPDYKLSPDWLA